ncbi:MAG: protein adenylyltransferase SelO [Opitutales bacterium]
MSIPFDNTYAKLPEKFYSNPTPAAVRAPGLIRVNHALANELGIDPQWLESAEGIAVIAGNEVPEGAKPISQAYAGHQFGNFVPQLGDGRAILLGEVVAKSGKRYDIQLKGSGPTHWSRRGDGRSALGPVLREYIVSEAMHALGVPTTRALAAVTSGEEVFRGEMEAGGVFTRVASSHIRVGTFQYFAAREDYESLRSLADYTIDRHYPEAADQESPYIALLNAVIMAQTRLVSKWLGLGFIHGVMNTDNCAVSGETIDYGPCAFMEQFHPQCVYSSIDQQGRYAWGNQPQIAHWNLTRFAETLLPLIDDDLDTAIPLAEKALESFSPAFHSAYLDTFSQKLGLARDDAQTTSFIKNTLEKLARHNVDYTLFFRHLTRVATGEDSTELVELWDNASEARKWLEGWSALAQAESNLPQMQAANPVLIPRNHQVERAIRAGYSGDFAPFHRLIEALAQPFADRPEYTDLEAAAKPEERVTETFCGT